VFLAIVDEEPPPTQLVIDGVCQAYGCLPSEAEAEMDRLPAGALFELMAVRSFAAAVRQLESTPMKDWEKVPESPMKQLAEDLFGLRAVGRL
jgi:hypothetical protein